VALLGTWVPDGVLLVLSVIALALTRPDRAFVDVARKNGPVEQPV
jgi:hypothetical protein